MTTDTCLPYELPIDVQPNDIDQLGHVNNVVYLRWVQEAAIAHYSAIATAEELESLLWVVARHEIDYKRPVFQHDTIIAKTWIGRQKGRFFERYTELLRQSDRKLVARARTLWCPVDAETLRPVEPPQEVVERFAKG